MCLRVSIGVEVNSQGVWEYTMLGFRFLAEMVLGFVA